MANFAVALLETMKPWVGRHPAHNAAHATIALLHKRDEQTALLVNGSTTSHDVAAFRVAMQSSHDMEISSSIKDCD
jgi:hypothetical protein